MARVFSGIQPTGTKHLGNLIGAIRHWVRDQDEADCLYCIVDLHSLTRTVDPQELRASSLSVATLLLAAGIDPERAILFVQSHVREHTELTWIFNCVATFGELRRMTQFKDKSRGSESVSAGLFDYPVLQAADVLLYGGERVPVGDDQRQHLELMRDLAVRFNGRYGETFPVPEASIPRVGARIMDLQEPTRKMSTSDTGDAGTLYLLDPPDALAKKIRSAVTDSGREVRAAPDKPGVTALLEILSAITETPVPALEERYDGAGYGQFKGDVAEAVVEYLRPLQERHAALASDPAEVARALARGADRARAIAVPTMVRVRERVGLLDTAAVDG
jgi:tryptophanyl-tRNA synthetase